MSSPSSSSSSSIPSVVPQLVTAFLDEASDAIDSIRKLGPEAALQVATEQLNALSMKSDHPLAKHVDAAQSALKTAQKLMRLFS